MGGVTVKWSRALPKINAKRMGFDKIIASIMERTMPRFVSAAAAYFAAIFALGFLLGTLRVMVTAPAIGEVWATVLELPVMLAASWFMCAWAIQRFEVPSSAGPRAGMGLLALLLLLTAETVLGVAGFGRTLDQQFSEYQKLGPALGLVAQIAFAAFPLVQRPTVTAPPERPTR
jgi:hypothetical protein